MTIRPLHDRILVKRLARAGQDRRRPLHPRHGQGEAAGGRGRRRRQRQGPGGRQAAPARGQGGRQGPVRQVLGHRSEDRRRGAPHPARGRHPRASSRSKETRNMAAKEILFDAKARAQIAAGLNILANTVKVTLGPRGRNVIIEKSWGAPTVTKDGVTVAKEIELEDKFANMGAQMVKEVASKTSDVAGDGTTTATVLAQAIYTEGAQAGRRRRTTRWTSSAASTPPSSTIVENLKEQSKPTKGKTEIAQVGTISANGDDDDRRHHRRGDGEGRQGRRHHRRGSEVDGDDAGRGRGHAVRPRLPVALLRDRRRAHGGGAGGLPHPHPREEALEHEGPAAGARAGGQERASRCSSSPRTSTARRWPRWWSTSCAARCTSARSRRRASAIAARRC